MRLYFSWRISLVGVLLVCGMLRLSYWQWTRHVEKQAYIQKLEERLNRDPVSLRDLLAENRSIEEMMHRRVLVQGTYDFENEMVIRNRKHDIDPGVHVLTPLRVDGLEQVVLVNRGFLPFNVSDRSSRERYRDDERVSFIGLVKEPEPRGSFGPPDPPAGEGHPWVDAWLRVDLEQIQKQLPYPLLPIWLELMESEDPSSAAGKIVSTSAGREEILMPGGAAAISMGDPKPGVSYPIPAFSTVIPPGRHFGYVFEWAFLALLVVLSCLLLQLRPPGTRFRRRTA